MSAEIDIRGVEHVGVVVGNTIGLAEWYGRKFAALEVSRSPDTPPIIFLSFGGGSLLELIPGRDQANEATDHIHLSFSVGSINVAVQELEAAGVSLEKPVFNAYEGSPVAFFRDPEGNLIQLVERVSDLPQPS